MPRGSRHIPWIGVPALVLAALVVVPAQARRGTPRACDGHALTPAEQRDGLGRHYIFGTPGPDVIAGTAGDDTIFGYESGDIICGYTGDDHIYGGDGIDTIFGNEGRDRLSGGAGTDVLDGGDDRDVCVQEAGEPGGASCEVPLGFPFYELDQALSVLYPRP